MTNKSDAASSTQPRTVRQRVYDFTGLPTHRKLERLRDMGLYVEGDCDLPRDKCDLVWLARAKEKGLVDALLDGDAAASRTVEAQDENSDYGVYMNQTNPLSQMRSAQRIFGKSPISLLEWLKERHENCARLADQKTGDDQTGWLEDEKYFALAINTLAKAEEKLAEFGQEWDGEKYVFNGQDNPNPKLKRYMRNIRG